MFTHMDYIYEVYQKRSFSKAAQKLFISQSSLSLTIKRAEEKIGMPIFDRSTYPIQLTEFGTLYINAVEDIRSITQGLTDYIHDVNHLQKGQLSVGASNFFGTYLIAPAVSLFKKQYPNISVKMHEGQTTDLQSKLTNGSIDLLVSNWTLDPAAFHREFLFTEQLLLAVPRGLMDSPLCQESVVTAEDLEGERFRQIPGVSLKQFAQIPFVGMRQGNDSRTRMEMMFADAGVQPQWVLELDQASTAYHLVCDGMGASVVANTIIRAMGVQPNVILYKLDHPQARRDVAIYTRKVSYVTRTMDAFIQILRNREQ